MSSTKDFVIVLVVLFVLCCASDQSDHKHINKIESHNKYCELQAKNCNHTLHPLCTTFNPTHYPVEDYSFYALAQEDIEFILTTLNAFRNDLAAGNIMGQKSGSNLRIVKWSDDYGRLLKAKLMYGSVCTEISLTGQITLDMVEFSDTLDEGDQHFYRPMFSEKVLNDSTSNSPWIDIFRAEFDLIGCVYYEYDEHESKTFACFINQYGPRDDEIHMDNLYEYGAPCSKCEEGECSEAWPNLCDESIQNHPTGRDYNLIMICVAISICTLILIVIARLVITRRRNSKSVKIEMT